MSGVERPVSHWEARLGIVTVRLDGDLEGSTCEHLRQLAVVAVEAGATDVHVDAAGVTFAGSAAIRALVEVRNLVVDRGGRFELVLPSPPLVRVLEVLGLESHFAA
jgi:anti-anti-sigma factor